MPGAMVLKGRQGCAKSMRVVSAATMSTTLRQRSTSVPHGPPARLPSSMRMLCGSRAPLRLLTMNHVKCEACITSTPFQHCSRQSEGHVGDADPHACTYVDLAFIPADASIDEAVERSVEKAAHRVWQLQVIWPNDDAQEGLQPGLATPEQHLVVSLVLAVLL